MWLVGFARLITTGPKLFAQYRNVRGWTRPMDIVFRQLAKLTAAIETLRHDFVAMCQLTGSPAARNAPPFELPISNDEDFRQLNEDLRNAHFLARLVSKFTLLNHYIPTTGRPCG